MNHKSFMKRALTLAAKGNTAPNPQVGAVIVKDGTVIGEGFHLKHGDPHAEAAAITNAGKAAHNASLYTSLEPCCSRYPGKINPPCTEKIIEAGIKKVFIAAIDPNPKVNGKGIKRLAESGIEVVTGLLQKEEKLVNRKYHYYHNSGLPYLHLKMAQTMDGFIAPPGKGKVKISSDESRKKVHELRSKYEAVMIGRKTAELDNPLLTCRDAEGKDPVIIILDTNLSLPLDLNIFNSADTPVYIFCSKQIKNDKKRILEKNPAIQIVEVDSLNNSFLNIRTVLKKIGDSGITSILCEGGGKLAGYLLENDFAQEITWFIAPFFMGSGTPAVTPLKNNQVDFANFKLKENSFSGRDLMITGLHKKIYQFSGGII